MHFQQSRQNPNLVGVGACNTDAIASLRIESLSFCDASAVLLRSRQLCNHSYCKIFLDEFSSSIFITETRLSEVLCFGTFTRSFPTKLFLISVNRYSRLSFAQRMQLDLFSSKFFIPVGDSLTDFINSFTLSSHGNVFFPTIGDTLLD